MSFTTEPLRAEHFGRLHDLFDAVCREKRFLAFTRAASKDATFSFYRQILAARDTHFVALRLDEILGWCDVRRESADVRQHVGVLGLAVRADSRGQGIGRALIHQALAHATQRGITRIELTVHAENHVAQGLYRSVGFEAEGRQRKGWRIDTTYHDVLNMARITPDQDAGPPVRVP